MASVFMSPKKWRQVDQWVTEVHKHLTEGTLTHDTVSVIPKEYKIGDEPNPRSSMRSTVDSGTSSVAVHGCQPVLRPTSAVSNMGTYRPLSSMTRRSVSGLETNPSVAVVRPSTSRTPPRTEIKLTNTSNTGSSTHVNRQRRCCCCCSNGSVAPNASSPGGWVSPSVANFLPANRQRVPYNQPTKSTGEGSFHDAKTYQLSYQHVPKFVRPETESHVHHSGYPPWVTGASVVISANQMRGTPQMAYKAPNVMLSRSDNKYSGNRWKTEPANSKVVPVDPVPVH